MDSDHSQHPDNIEARPDQQTGGYDQPDMDSDINDIKAFGPVVEADWLANNLGSVVVADVRWYLDGRSGRDAYDRGHLPGARFVDLDADLSAAPSPGSGRHPLPDPDRFAAAMGRLGIGDGDRVVVYDDAGGVIAARLWWMLDSLGHPAAVLDGGIGTWAGPLETAPPVWAPAEFTARRWPEDRFVNIDEMDRLRDRPGIVVIDARSAERYRGEPNSIDPRFGHIPGALNMPATGNLAADGRLLPASELRSRYAAIGAAASDTSKLGAKSDTETSDTEASISIGEPGPEASDTGIEEPGTGKSARTSNVIAYCGSGVSACCDLLALRRAGLGNGKLFVGSWSAWGADPARPIETSRSAVSGG